MAEVTAFRGILLFFEKIGVYDVVLPFLLVFSIVFAILEKTKVLGVEKVEGKEYTKKNLNSMVSFVVSFLVIASSRLVEIITTVSAQVVVLLMASILFLLLVGSFFKEGAGVFLEGGWRTGFMWVMFIGILLIFLNALGWLDDFWGWVSEGTGGNAVGSIILLIVVILFMWFVVRSPEQKPAVKKE
jgi:hypothetical protein